MAEFKHAHITVLIPEDIVIPPEAGNLSEAEVARIPKARKGLGTASEQAAACLSTAPSGFVAGDVLPQDLVRKGMMADRVDHVIVEVEGLLHKLKQANLIIDAEAWEALRKLNDLVKAQGKHRPEILAHFKPLADFMSKRRKAEKTDQG